MTSLNHQPIEVSPHLFQVGTPAFPAYLSVGEECMLVEGGTGATFGIIVDQIKVLGIEPEAVKYIILTHTHADHIGAVPHFKRAWPHIKLLASDIGKQTLARTELFKQFQLIDLGIAQLMKAKSEIDALPDPVKNYSFHVDSVVQEGDKIDLGRGTVWHVYETPGHSPCHLSLLEEKEKILVLGDATGFYVPEKDMFWPNYFQSVHLYCDSIRKLAGLDAERAVLSHNGAINGDVRGYLEKAMKETEKYYRETVERTNRGEAVEKIAMDKARYVDSLTDIQPFKTIYDLCEVMIKNSLSNGSGVNGLFRF